MHDWTEHNPLSVFVWGAVKHPGKARDKIGENIFRTTYQIYKPDPTSSSVSYMQRKNHARVLFPGGSR